MSYWSDSFNAHPVFEHLKSVGAAIDSALTREGITAEQIESIERVRLVLAFIGRRLATADPNLVRAGVLDGIDQYLPGTVNHLAAFLVDGDPGNLVHANNHIELSLHGLSGLAAPETIVDLESLRTSAQSYRETMSAQLREFGADAAASKQLTDGLASSLDEARLAFGKTSAELEGVLNTFKTETLAAQTTLAKVYEGAEQRIASSVDAKVGEWQGTFEAAEKSRFDSFSAETAGQLKTFDALMEKSETTLKATDATWDQKLADAHTAHGAAQSKLQIEYEAKAASIIATMQGQLHRVQELVGAIGDHGVTAGFKREADDAKSEVVYWQRITFWSMVFLILVGVATAFHVFEYKLTWISLASRLYLSVATGVLAGYAANQASRYQQRERRNRKLELELRALGPFLEPVEPAEREKFRLKIAEVFFGKDDGITDKPGPATALQGSKETFDKALDLLKTAIEKLPGKN